MARKCICSATKESGTTDIFYCINDKGKNKYYKSEEVYNEYMKDQEYKRKTIEYFLSLLGYEYSNYLKKRLGELNEHFTYEIIYLAFIKQTDRIKYVLNDKLRYSTEQQKISYIIKIIESVINDIKPFKQVEENSVEVNIEELNNIKIKLIKRVDIRQYLDEEDL